MERRQEVWRTETRDEVRVYKELERMKEKESVKEIVARIGGSVVLAMGGLFGPWWLLGEKNALEKYSLFR